MRLLHLIVIHFKALLGFPEAKLAKKILQLNPSSIHIYAMGEIGKNLFVLLHNVRRQNTVKALYDSKAEYNPFSFMNHQVKGPDLLDVSSSDTVVIASVEFEKRILEQLQAKLQEAKVISISS